MKEFFKQKRFSPESQSVLDASVRIIERYQDAGYTLSLRQLYYQLVSANIVPNTEKSYKRVGDIIADARMAGLADWDMIEDRGRVLVKVPHWDKPGEIIKSAAAAYRIDKWATQPSYCEVMVEKQALEGVLEPVCRELDIPFTANKGYSSVTMMYYAGRRLAKEFLNRAAKLIQIPSDLIDDRPLKFIQYLEKYGFVDNCAELTDKGRSLGLQPITVFYLGDHDPSGIDMTRDVQDRLRTFSDFSPIVVKRLALNMNQIEELQPPENPAKMSDSRAADYVSKFGESSWELDAVEPAAMATMVREAVLEIRDEESWEKALVREEKERGILKDMAIAANKKAK